MLSYQHHYHAGNHADVIKHWLLLECLTYLQKKDKPFDYIDTHAGAGLYALNSKEALKTQESVQGVLRLNQQTISGLATYFENIEQDLASKRYPGSPMLVKRLLRPTDKAWLFETHPQTIRELREHCAKKGRVYVEQENGFQGLIRLLPNHAKRALVLIDPAYEIKSDYDTVVDVISKAYRRMPQAMILLWYPVVERQRIQQLERRIKTSTLRNVQLFELGVADDIEKGMTASGLIIVNPPWTLADHFLNTVPEVAKQLTQDGIPRYRHVQLLGE